MPSIKLTGKAVVGDSPIRREYDTPITYQVKGRQYVVIAAGGGKDLKSKSGGVYVAFTVK